MNNNDYISRGDALAVVQYNPNPVEGIKELPAADLVPVDDMFGEMMNWAVRYALGRRTYAATDTARYIAPLVPKLSDKTLLAMREDLKPNTPWNPPKNYGDPCDEVEWMRLLEAVERELQRRKEQ